jgi:hypothetical protein
VIVVVAMVLVSFERGFFGECGRAVLFGRPGVQSGTGKLELIGWNS